METEKSRSLHNRQTLARKTKSSSLVATVREGAERGIYCAASNNLVDVIENQVKKGVVDLAWKKESSIWNDSSIKALL